MQFNNARYCLIAAALVALGGCEKPPGSDVAPSTEATAKVGELSSGSSYEIIVHTRPDDLQHYLKLAKAGYDICVVGATQLNVAVRPFVNVPDDFIIERNTYISDGKSFHTVTESFSIDQTSMEEGCVTSIGSHKSATTIGDGFIYSVESDGSSPDVVTPKEPYDNSYNRPHDYSDYNTAKIVNEVNLLCGKDLPVLSELAENMCMVTDAAGKILLDSELEAIIGYMKIYSVKDLQGVLTIEPVSVKTGISIDPKIFSMEGS